MNPREAGDNTTDVDLRRFPSIDSKVELENGIDSFDTSPCTSLKGSKRDRNGDILDENNQVIADRGSSNVFLLRALETRGQEVSQLKKKILSLEKDKKNSMKKFMSLEILYNELKDEMEANNEKNKKKKKKGVIQRAVSAVRKNFTKGKPDKNAKMNASSDSI